MTKEDLYKEAEEWTISNVCKDCSRYEECKSKERCTCKECSKEKWKNGAWFGYPIMKSMNVFKTLVVVYFI